MDVASGAQAPLASKPNYAREADGGSGRLLKAAMLLQWREGSIFNWHDSTLFARMLPSLAVLGEQRAYLDEQRCKSQA